MSTLDISEYVDSSHGNLIEPPIAHQTLEIGDEPATSRPLHKHTRIVRGVSGDDCLISIAVGASSAEQSNVIPTNRFQPRALPTSLFKARISVDERRNMISIGSFIASSRVLTRAIQTRSASV
jgi:hypothetical protein